MTPFYILSILSIGLSMSVSYDKQCTCDKFTTDSTCLEHSNCYWDTVLCQTRTCSNYYFQDDCNAAPSCSWNVSKCETFTKCSDYYVNDSYDCYKIGNDALQKQCQPTIEGNSCVDFEYTPCGKTAEDCTGFANFWTVCYWTAGSCISVDIRQCSQLVNLELCTIFGIGLGCQWINNTCSALTCADFTTEATCALERQNNIIEDLQLCKWAETVCVQADDISHLDYSNCFTNSFQNYLWDSDNSKCVECSTYKPITTSTP